MTVDSTGLSEVEIAKYLLADMSCDTCKHVRRPMNSKDTLCQSPERIESYIDAKFVALCLPYDKVCKYWQPYEK